MNCMTTLLWNGTSTSPAEVFSGVNKLTADNPLGVGLLGIMLLLAIWLIVFFRLRDSLQKDSITVSCFVTFIAASLMAIIGFIEPGVWVTTLVLMIGSLVLLINR